MGSGFLNSRSLSAAVVALISMVIPTLGLPATGQTAVVDQEQTAWNVGASFGNNGYAQSFVPTMGVLTRVELQLTVSQEALGEVELRIYGDDGAGYPDVSTVLASQMLVPGPDTIDYGFAIDGWFVADFDDIDVIPGERYYIWADTPLGVWPSGNWHQAD